MQLGLHRRLGDILFIPISKQILICDAGRIALR